MISRRDFFRSGFSGAFETVARTAGALGDAIAPPGSTAPEPPAPVFLRPPGALPEKEFRKTCTSCDACIVACPKFAVRKAGFELGRGVEGPPIVLPDEQPCWLCPDMPCISACEPGALLPVADPRDVRMGTLRLREEACYAAQGSICDVCAERCPVRPKPIRVAFGEAPVIDSDACTGCGVCAWLCPADALDVVPRSPR